MSALAGVFGPAAGASTGALRDMMDAMRARHSEPHEEFLGDGIRLRAARHKWEESLNGWSGPLIVMDHSWVVAADATLYYQADLRRRLRQAPASTNTGELLLLALGEWGPYFARYVEGDYAIVAWERRSGRVLLARDFGGRRNLVYARAGTSLVVASSPTALVRHPDVSLEYDQAFLAIAAAGGMSHGPRTGFRDVLAVPGGSTLAVDGSRVTLIERWTPPLPEQAWESELSAAAGEELRALLVDATRERLAADGSTTVWMSGGWDSTAVFASGKSALASRPNERGRLRPISVSLGKDDWGFEDDHIQAAADHWSEPVDWLHIDQIPLIDDAERRARVRDDPMVQSFESMVRTLAKRSVDLGSRVALDGFGGDHLFLVSGGALTSSHLFHGRWSRLWAHWKAWQEGFRPFLRECLLPLMSPSLCGWIGTVRRRAPAGYWDRSLPAWIRPTPQLLTELQPEFEREPGESPAAYEFRYMVTNSIVPRALAWNHTMAMDEGVQLRGPIFDPRVISFASRRPASDRGGGADGKRILRLAMAGLLPDSVLAPRPRKTGTTGGYFRRQLQARLESEIVRAFGTRNSMLEEMGIVDAHAVLSAAQHYTAHGSHLTGAFLHLTLETERWLRVQSKAILAK